MVCYTCHYASPCFVSFRLNAVTTYDIVKALVSCADKTLGVVGAELRDKQWSKILSLAPMHL